MRSGTAATSKAKTISPNVYRLGNAIDQMDSDSVATLLRNRQKGATRLVLNEP